MFLPFQKRITSSTAYTGLLELTLKRGPQGPAGMYPGTDPVPFVLVVGATANTGTNNGARIRVAGGVGAQQFREFTLDDRSRRYSSRAISLTVEAQLVESGDDLLVSGGVAWDRDAGTETSPTFLTNLITRQTLSANVATVTSIGTLQREAMRLHAHADALSGGSAIVPVQVAIFGQRYIGSTWTRLGGFVVANAEPGGDVMEFPPGQFNAVGWRVLGFPSANGGSATVFVTEELGVEG